MANSLLCIIQEELESELKHIGYYSRYEDRISDVLNKEKDCQAVINLILNSNVYHMENQHTIGVAQKRAKHILITYLMGQYFLSFGNFSQKIMLSNKHNSNCIKNVWMLTALYHDCGYYSDDLKNDKLDLHKFNPCLLEKTELQSNELTNLHYTIDEIMAYDRYARTYHLQRMDDERIDHGILGGTWAYEKLCNSPHWVHSKLEIQEICITIAQHNIFKSNDEATDRYYLECGLERLTRMSPLIIQCTTPLLLFLSLVDTVECVKKFGRKVNKHESMNANTILKNIKVTASQKEIILDLSSLKKYIDKRKEKDGQQSKSEKNVSDESGLQAAYEQYTDSLTFISQWTSFNCNALGSDCYAITL